jgi:hypothetical protein
MINSVSLTSVLASALASQAASVEVGMATLNKSNEVSKQEGAALVQMIEASLPQTNERLLDTYA